MTDQQEHERLDGFLAEEIRAEYGSEPVPREEMWRSISAARGNHRRRRARRVAWATGLAAAAVAAWFLIARGPERPVGEGRPTTTASVGRDELLLRGHLARAGRLLAAAQDSLPGDAPQEARALLGPTRVLLDAPDGPASTRRLLEDAEVALALLARAGASQSPSARDALRATLAAGGIAERLQDAAEAGGG